MRFFRLEDVINEVGEDNVDFDVEVCEIMLIDVCDDSNVEDVEFLNFINFSENVDIFSRKYDFYVSGEFIVGVVIIFSGMSNLFNLDVIKKIVIVNLVLQLVIIFSGLNNLYDLDFISKIVILVNLVLFNDVLLSWLRDYDLNWFVFFEEVS